MRSYDGATESKTFLTRDSFDSSGTVLNPKDVVRGFDGFEDGGNPEEDKCRAHFMEPYQEKGSGLREGNRSNIYVN